jgi:hypothetical protein
MAYRGNRWRNAWGEVRDPSEETHTDLKRMVAKDASTGTFENLGNILNQMVRFQGQTLDRFGKLEIRIALLMDRVKLLLWVGGVLFIAAIGVLVKDGHGHQ